MFLDIGGVRSLDTLAGNSPLGAQMRTNSDGTEFLAVKLYNGTGAACVVGAPYIVTFDGDEETNPKVATVASLAVYQHVVVALEATAAAAWGWFAIQGTVALTAVEGTTDVAKDDFLKIVTATSAVSMIKDAATRSTASFAIACEAQAANSVVNIRCFLLGDRALCG